MRRAHPSRSGSGWLAALVCAVSVCVLAGTASAATFTAACSGTTGDPVSLVAAPNSANAAGGSNVVQLGAGCTYTLTAVDNNWYGPNGLPAIASDITFGEWTDDRAQRGAGDAAFQAVLRRRSVRQRRYGQLRFAWSGRAM